MGQGRNALYLASQGWRVTGIDISDEGLRQAREAAAARHLTIEAINANSDTWDFGVEKWDLVVLIYAGGDDNMVKRSLKRGGLVVTERAHKDTNPRIGVETGAFSAAYAGGFKILRDEVVEDVSDLGVEGLDPRQAVPVRRREAVHAAIPLRGEACHLDEPRMYPSRSHAVFASARTSASAVRPSPSGRGPHRRQKPVRVYRRVGRDQHLSRRGVPSRPRASGG